MSPYNEPLKTIKPQFLELISAIRHYRLNSLGKVGLIFISQEKIEEHALNKYIYQLFNC